MHTFLNKDRDTYLQCVMEGESGEKGGNQWDMNVTYTPAAIQPLMTAIVFLDNKLNRFFLGKRLNL